LNDPHQPVLVEEVVQYLLVSPRGTYVDATVGMGGHSRAIGKRLLGEGRLICLDRDPEAVRFSSKRLAFLGERVNAVQANYADVDRVLRDLSVAEVNGILLDLGMSSFQLERSGRGFSFSRDEPLDMRMNPKDKLTAYDLVNRSPQKDLERFLREYGEEKRAKQITKAIVRARMKSPIESSLRLATLIESIFPGAHRFKGKHPATRTFQALRVVVNKELENLEIFFQKAPPLMAKGGRLVILSYHSLEDRMVKHAMLAWERGCTCPPDLPHCVCGKAPILKRVLRKARKPSPEEIQRNPRARSAVMRVAERI